MFYLFFVFLSFLIQFFFLLSTNIEIPTEIFFFSYLVNKGLIPYRDFFDHHGFLLYYLAAPLMPDKSLFLVKLFYVLIQSLNLALVLSIVKKISNKSGFISASIIYPFVSFFNSKNVLWYETIILTFYLLVYYLILSRIKYKDYLIGFLIGLSSLVKPQAAIMLMFLLFFTKSVKILFGFFSVWSATFVYFSLNKALPQILDNLFRFNLFLQKNYPKSTFFHFDGKKVLLGIVFMIILSFIFLALSKKLKKTTPLLIFFFSSLAFIGTGLAEVTHLLPILTFSVILFSLSLKEIRKTFRPIYIFFLILFFALLAQKTLKFYLLNQTRITTIRNEKPNKIASQVQKIGLGNEKIFVLGGYVQIYYLLDKLPQTYFPLGFSLIDVYYPDYEKRVISDIQQNQVKYIIVQNNKDEYNKIELSLKKYFEENYRLFSLEKDFAVYTK